MVILDEFQYITQSVYRDEKCEGKPDESLPGSYHSLSEAKAEAKAIIFKAMAEAKAKHILENETAPQLQKCQCE